MLLSDIAVMCNSTTAHSDKQEICGTNLRKLLDAATTADFTLPNVDLAGNTQVFERDRF